MVAAVVTRERIALPHPVDIEVRAGDQRFIPGFGKNTPNDGSAATPANLTGWDFEVECEFYDGEVTDGEVLDQVARVDGQQNKASVALIDGPTGHVLLTLDEDLCPANPPIGTHIIVFVYVRAIDPRDPEPNKSTRPFVVTYAHNARRFA